MGDEATLIETNRLLSEVLRLREEDLAEKARITQEMEAMRASAETGGERLRAEALEKRGLPAELAQGSEEDWERRREEATRRTAENLQTLADKDALYKKELLTELRVQSDLLRRIAERLEG